MTSRNMNNDSSHPPKSTAWPVSLGEMPSSEAASVLLELKESSTATMSTTSTTHATNRGISHPVMTTLGPLSTPDKRHVHAKTGMVHGTIRVHRQRTTLGQTVLRFEYVLEEPKGSSNNDNDDNKHNNKDTHVPLLVAYRPREESDQLNDPSTGSNLISGITPWTWNKRQYVIAPFSNPHSTLGELSVLPLRNEHVVAFSLTLSHQMDCCFLYKAHSLPSILASKASGHSALLTRQVEMVRFTARAQNVGRSKTMHPARKPPGMNPFQLELMKGCSQLLQPPTMGNPNKTKIFYDTSYVNIFSSKQPTIKVGQSVPTLNMKGRGRVASNKNAQLVCDDPNGTICVQVAKVDQDTFHLDFGYPLTPVQAFAFGIAQIVL